MVGEVKNQLVIIQAVAILNTKYSVCVGALSPVKVPVPIILRLMTQLSVISKATNHVRLDPTPFVEIVRQTVLVEVSCEAELGRHIDRDI